MSACAKCNTEVPAGSQFCSVCGTPVAAAPPAAPAFTPVSMPTPTASAPPPPGYAPQYAAAPPPSGNSALKIILIVVAIFVGLGILGAGAVGFMAWRVAHSIRVNGTGPNGQVSISTPGGSFSAGGSSSVTADDLGTDIYPGAQSTEGSMRINTPGGSVVTGVYLTSDSKDAVRDFYKGKFGSDASIYDTDNGAVLSVNKGEQESVMVTVSAKQSENDGKTKIVIVHSKNKKTS